MTVGELYNIVKEADTGCSPYYDIIPRLIRERNYQNGIEIGVLFGGHAKQILDTTNLKSLVGIDPYKLYEQGILHLETQEDFDTVCEFAYERLKTPRYYHIRLTSDQAFNVLLYSEEMYDFVFIDGLHTYDQVKKDLNNYSQIIRKGGVIACHDYNHPNFPLLTTAIDEFAKEHNTKVNIYKFHAVYMDKTW